MPNLSVTQPAAIARRPDLSGHRRGFSLVEILVVVGILAVLITLAVVGFKVVGGVSKDKVTQTALENCKSLVNEFELTGGKELLDSGYIAASLATGTAWRWEPADATTGLATDFNNVRMNTPDTIRTSGAVETNPDTRLIRERVLRDETARVLKRLMNNPKNRAAIEAMPADHVMKVRFPNDANLNTLPTVTNGVADYPATANYLIDGVVLLDGYGKPIYFVPPGGLIHVNLGYKDKGDLGDAMNYDAPGRTVRATDRRCFWASPGPDGNLTAGDDNVYSTPVEMR
jgi:prepilin-type N-terminal cleavage/methylation domain-containing protein